MSDEGLAALAENIRRNGLNQAITLIDGAILDGRNREKACEMAGVKARYVEWEGKGKQSPVEWVWAQNGERRHLTASQRAAVGADMMPMLKAEARERQKEHGGTAPGRGKTLTQKIEQVKDKNENTAAARAAAVTGTNRQYVSDARSIGWPAGVE